MITTIYIPDDLHARVKASGLNVSRTCREALVAKLDRIEQESELKSELIYELTATARDLLGARSHIKNLERALAEKDAVIAALTRIVTGRQPSISDVKDQLAERREHLAATRKVTVNL